MIYPTEGRLFALVFILLFDVMAFVAVRSLLDGQVWVWFSEGPTRSEQPIRYWLGAFGHSLFALGAAVFTVLVFVSFFQRPPV
ncbi:MAG TPA: hypothetical protein VH331_11305 [Allosphingosinicella sp.]|jgi:hypothetical protein|nr:hypothetical protein [Allosphingosinicella sp.]